MDNYTTIIKTMNSRPITVEDFLKIEASSNTDPNILEFAKRYRDEFCSDVELDFMEYFLELADPKNRGKFIVPHGKLYEYGITVDKQSNSALERIAKLKLVEDVDYQSGNFRNTSGRGGKPRIEYTFTPKAFKNILLSATTHKKHTVDVQRYRDYYLFLEEMIVQFNICQLIRKDIENEALADDNRSLNAKVDELLEDNASLKTDVKSLIDANTGLQTDVKSLIDDNVELKNTANQLLTYSQNANVMLVDMKASIDELTGIARMALPMWIGSSVAKTMVDKFKKQYNTDLSAIKHMRVAFVCGFYMGNKLKIYFCARNFIEMGPRIKELDERHAKNMYMLRPKAINLISQDISMELATIRGAEFKNIKSIHQGRTKSFDITVASKISMKMAYKSVVDQLIDARMQVHQKRRDDMIATQNLMTTAAVMTHITSTDKMFFDKTRPWCQMCIDGYITQCVDDNNVFTEYGYQNLSTSTKKRPSFNNKWMRDNQYALMNIKQLVDEDKGVSVFDDMVKNGVITEEDRPILTALANSMAK